MCESCNLIKKFCNLKQFKWTELCKIKKYVHNIKQ